MRAKAASRRFLCLYATIGAALVAGAGCKTTQPEQVGTQTFSLSVRATTSNTDVETFDVYRMFRDNNGDSQPDDVTDPPDGVPDTWLWCKRTVDSMGIPPGQELTPRSVAWPYTVEVRIIRAGQTNAELVTSFDASQMPISTADPDNSLISITTIPTQAPIVNGTDTYQFTSLYRSTALRAEVLAATSNPLTTANSAMYGFAAGLCSTLSPPVAMLDGNPTPFTVEIEKGDTILVAAREADSSPLVGTAIKNSADPVLQASISIDGREVSPTSGSTVATLGPSGGFNFTLTPF